MQINEIHILHLFESCHVYIKIYLSGPIGEEENVAKSNSKLCIGYGPKPLNYVFNISCLFPILQINYDY